MSGWVKSHRSIMDWEWYSAPNMFHFFQHLIMKANHKETQWRGAIIKRGQLLTGRKKLSSETGISERSVRTCLKNLTETGEIIVKATNSFSIITICNYDNYQDKNISSDQQTTSELTSKRPAKRPTNDQRTDHIQEVKNLKEVKNVKKRRNNKAIRPNNFSEKEWDDLVSHRKTMKAPLSKIALSGLVNQFGKSGLSVSECIQEMANRGWKGFKADWVSGNKKTKTFSEIRNDNNKQACREFAEE